MSGSASLTSGVAGRYATALFEIAREGDSLEKVEQDLEALEDALAESKDLRAMIASPIPTRGEQVAAMRAIADRMDLGPEVANTVGLMAANRRLFVLPQMVTNVKGMIAEHRGEVTAKVTSAKRLSQSQMGALSESLRSGIGKNVKVDVVVDESLIGGLIVRVGSRMVDTSIRSKLASLQNVMKEVG